MAEQLDNDARNSNPGRDSGQGKVPVLTDIIVAGDSGRQSAAAGDEPAAAGADKAVSDSGKDTDALVAEVMRAITPAVEKLVREALVAIRIDKDDKRRFRKHAD